MHGGKSNKRRNIVNGSLPIDDGRNLQKIHISSTDTCSSCLQQNRKKTWWRNQGRKPALFMSLFPW